MKKLLLILALLVTACSANTIEVPKSKPPATLQVPFSPRPPDQDAGEGDGDEDTMNPPPERISWGWAKIMGWD